MSLHQQLISSLRERSRQPDFWFNSLLFALLALTFWPITAWVADGAQNQSRMLHALIVLTLACVLLVLSGGIEVRQAFTLNRIARRYLIAAYTLFMISVIVPRLTDHGGVALVASLLSLPAYCSGFGAFILFVFGEGTRRITRTITGTLCAFFSRRSASWLSFCWHHF